MCVDDMMWWTVPVRPYRKAKNLWNLTQISDAPAEVKGAACAGGPVADFAILQLHDRTFAGYTRWRSHTDFADLSPKDQPATLGFVHGADAARRQLAGARLADTRLNQTALFELLYSEAANCRLLPEMLSFTYHAAACTVVAPSAAHAAARPLRNSGLPLPPGRAGALLHFSPQPEPLLSR